MCYFKSHFSISMWGVEMNNMLSDSRSQHCAVALYGARTEQETWQSVRTWIKRHARTVSELVPNEKVIWKLYWRPLILCFIEIVFVNYKVYTSLVSRCASSRKCWFLKPWRNFCWNETRLYLEELCLHTAVCFQNVVLFISARKLLYLGIARINNKLGN